MLETDGEKWQGLEIQPELRIFFGEWQKSSIQRFVDALEIRVKTGGNSVLKKLGLEG